jgi:tetratricopeptide (TPR) repeat protein
LGGKSRACARRFGETDAGQDALMQRVRVFLIVAGALVWLTGCSSAKFAEMFKPRDGAEANASVDPDQTGTVAAVIGEDGSNVGLLGTDPKDDLSLGKQHFRQENFGLAEHYFRRAAESHPRDAEAWLGLAAAYDRLRRFELADRAYKQAIVLAGTTPEILNNQGYSYMLRGDYARARTKLAEARALDPKSPYILNNIKLLAESSRKAKAIQ